MNKAIKRYQCHCEADSTVCKRDLDPVRETQEHSASQRNEMPEESGRKDYIGQKEERGHQVETGKSSGGIDSGEETDRMAEEYGGNDRGQPSKEGARALIHYLSGFTNCNIKHPSRGHQPHDQWYAVHRHGER